MKISFLICFAATSVVFAQPRGSVTLGDNAVSSPNRQGDRTALTNATRAASQATLGPKQVNSTTFGVSWAKHALQGFNMKVWLSNQMTLGSLAWDPGFSASTQVPPSDCGDIGLGLEYPVGSCIDHLSGAGPWIGGKIDGVRHVDEGYNGDDARHEFEPERWDTARDHIWHTHTGVESFDPDGYNGYYFNRGIRVNQRDVDDDGDGRIDEDELDGLDNDGDWSPLTDDLGADGLPDSLEVSCDGKGYDPVSNPDPAYDNYDTAAVNKCRLDRFGNYLRKNDRGLYTQNNGIPDHGEPHVDEDYGAVSDNDLYFSATDTFKSFTIAGHVPMGIKVFAKSYAWKSTIPEPILPIEYDFINIGRNTITDVYLGFFADMDIGPINVFGYYIHNFAGYYHNLYTPYIHNCVDRGSTPLGLTLLGSSKRLDSLKYVFQWQGFTEPGIVDSVTYAWMNGEAFDRPVKPDQYCSSPTDTRFIYAFGPFGTMHPGDTVRCYVALVSGDALDQGVNTLRDNITSAFAWHQRGYHAPVIPPSPVLRITTAKDKVFLKWGHHPGSPGANPYDSWDRYNKLLERPDTTWQGGRLMYPGGFNFEGFRVWRSDSREFDEKSFALLAEYRIHDDPLTGVHAKFDTAFVDSYVRQGNDYWYAVTSFSVRNGAIIPGRDSLGNQRNDTLYADSFESSIRDNAQLVHVSFGPSKRLGEAKVVPNPYRGDIYYTDGNGFEGTELSWSDARRVIWFIDLPERATIRIFTVAGDVITTIQHDDAARTATGRSAGQEEWNLFSESGRPIASGLYIFSVESTYGTQVGKFAVVR
jgi:hypothetical protein